MKSVFKLSLMLFAFLMISCESKEKEIEKLKSETIAVHDEVMPKMDDIMKLKKSLRAKEDSVSSHDSTKIKGLILSLEKSDKVMMNWMRNYDPQMEGMSDEEKIEYLKQQKSSIQEVSEQMRSSISEAEAYLNQ
ncbi:hypothetical protein [Marivirga sp.]|uniref:hypothetical protein n=1 Tax=Marivirga sp. TaxID=2018662 RepID=UPI0025FDE398|nr:hypothetical protein [Marivirga sp.]